MKSMNGYDQMLPALRMANSIFENEDPFEAFDRFLGSDNFVTTGFRSPAIDVSEDEKAYHIVAELPGLGQKDVKLEVKDGSLDLSVDKKEEIKEEDKKAKWLRRERKSFAFLRRFSLPDDADVDHIEANFKDGLLAIDLPKKPEKAPRVVQVKIA